MRINFSTPAQMKELCDMYFVRVKNYNRIIGYMRPSIDDLSGFLGLNKGEFLDYKEQPVFKHVVNMALMTIEADLELRTLSDEPDTEGVMYDLVNDFGWTPLDEEDRKLIALSIN